MTNGKNFRAAATELAAGHGRALTGVDLAGWVAEEKDVTAHLHIVLRPDVLRPDPAVYAHAAARSGWARPTPSPSRTRSTVPGHLGTRSTTVPACR